MKFWGFTYCRGLNSPVLYQLSYRGIYLVVASNLMVIKQCLQPQSIAFFAKRIL